MKIERIAKKYAQFIFEAAAAQAAETRVVSDFLSLEIALAENSDLSEFVFSPLVSGTMKLEILSKINFHPVSYKCLELVAVRRRWPLLGVLGKFLESERQKASGIAKGKVVSGQELDEAEKSSIRKSLEAMTRKKVDLSFSIDSDVIAGFVAEVEGLKVEETISNQLKNMSENLIRSVH